MTNSISHVAKLLRHIRSKWQIIMERYSMSQFIKDNQNIFHIDQKQSEQTLSYETRFNFSKIYL